MDLAELDERLRTETHVARCNLPPRMRVLYVTGYQRTGGWLAESLVADSGSDVLLEEAVGTAAGISRLRDEVFDIVLASHEADELDALALVAGLRAGGSDEPVVVLGTAPEHELVSRFYEAGADAYLSVGTTTTRTLIGTVARAVERTVLVRENRRLVEAERQRVAIEHQEAERLLAQQRALVGDLEAAMTFAAHDPAAPPNADEIAASADESRPAAAPDGGRLPDALVDHYRELLRAYVIMGSGNLTEEMRALADLLATAGVSARQTMRMHLVVLEEMVRTLGSRSARHVIARADLLVLEIMVHLAEGYRGRLRTRLHPPRQLGLPGFLPALESCAA